METFVRLKPKALNINLLDKKFGIYFMTPGIERAYLQLLIHRCSKCDNEIFQTFQQLKDHMRRQHEVFYCDLCSENLKIFSFERRFYNRSQLALHRRKGDPDDKSHKYVFIQGYFILCVTCIVESKKIEPITIFKVKL